MFALSENTWRLLQQLFVSGLVLGSWYALLGVSMSVIYSTTRTFHIAHAAVYTAAAYGTVVGSEILGLPLIPAILLGVAVAVALGIAIDGLGYRLLRSRNSSALITFLFSLGISVAFTNLVQLDSDRTRGRCTDFLTTPMRSVTCASHGPTSSGSSGAGF